jgi:hypothetical protein
MQEQKIYISEPYKEFEYIQTSGIDIAISSYTGKYELKDIDITFKSDYYRELYDIFKRKRKVNIYINNFELKNCFLREISVNIDYSVTVTINIDFCMYREIENIDWIKVNRRETIVNYILEEDLN